MPHLIKDINYCYRQKCPAKSARVCWFKGDCVNQGLDWYAWKKEEYVQL